MSEPPLSQSVGYGVVVGVGLLFALGMVLTTYCLRRYQREIMTSEEFSTAGRSVKTGLVAAAVVSSWTWAATLLQSSTQAYKNGISGPFWYAAGAAVQIILFATVAIELKKKAPNAHTYLEVIKARYGTATHFVYLFFALATNVLVTAMLLTGGSAVVNDLTGMNVVAACFLLPLGVVIYTLFGGIRATFLTDYVHTVIILVIVFLFAFATYATNEYLGSPGAVWDRLTELAKTRPVEGNIDGSYLTMRSKAGGIFFVINLAGNFGTVFLDNGYWNKAISASPVGALPGYVLGGLAWFAIPFLTATTMGIACLCLEGTPAFPQAGGLTPEQVNAGLALPTAAVALLGKSGAAAALVLIFMAVTSATSAELIAVSSIFTYDIYKGYFNLRATGKQLIFVSHLTVVLYGLVMAGFSVGLYYAKISMGWLYVVMGIIISAAVLPACLSLLWKGQNVYAAALSPIVGLVLAIIAWLTTAKGVYGSITIATTGDDYATLAGNVVALCSPVILIPLFTLLFKKDKFDFHKLQSIKSVREDEPPSLVSTSSGSIVTGREYESEMVDREKTPTLTAQELERISAMNNEKELANELMLHKYSKWSKIICVITILAFLVLWPMPMYGTGYVFSRKFFTGWIVVGIIWCFFSLFMVGLYPLYESRKPIWETLRGITWDCTGQTNKLRQWQSNQETNKAIVIGVEVECSPLESRTSFAGEK